MPQLHEPLHTGLHHRTGVLPGHRQGAFAENGGIHAGAAQQLLHRLFDELRLALLHDQQRLLACREAAHFLGHQGVGGVQHQYGDAAGTLEIRQAQFRQRPQQGVAQAALHDDAELFCLPFQNLVELGLADEVDGRRPALLHLAPLLQVGGRGQDDPLLIARRALQGVLQGEGRGPVVPRLEVAVHVAGADAQHQHHRGVAGLRKLEPPLHHAYDAGQVRTRVQQPDLRLHGEGVAALLHDAGAFAVVLPNDDQGAAQNAGGG